MKHFLQLKDLQKDEFAHLFGRTRTIKERFKNYVAYQPLADRMLAMVFEKSSTRTRVSFEAGIRPDVMPVAKGLGSGVPIGAVVCGPRAAGVFGPGNHGTTFGGNPLAMRAGVETLRIMEEHRLLENAAAVGKVLKDGLEKELAAVDGVVEVRGQGLMIGIELDRPCAALLGRSAEAGLMISVTAERVVRLLPSLILNRDEAAQIVAILCPLIKEFLREPA